MCLRQVSIAGDSGSLNWHLLVAFDGLGQCLFGTVHNKVAEG